MSFRDNYFYSVPKEERQKELFENLQIKCECYACEDDLDPENIDFLVHEKFTQLLKEIVTIRSREEFEEFLNTKVKPEENYELRMELLKTVFVQEHSFVDYRTFKSLEHEIDVIKEATSLLKMY